MDEVFHNYFPQLFHLGFLDFLVVSQHVIFAKSEIESRSKDILR